jgi:hypothetical protein
MLKLNSFEMILTINQFNDKICDCWAIFILNFGKKISKKAIDKISPIWYDNMA